MWLLFLLGCDAFQMGDQVIRRDATSLHAIKTVVEQIGYMTSVADVSLKVTHQRASDIRLVTQPELNARGLELCKRGALLWVPTVDRFQYLPAIAEGLVLYESFYVCHVQIEKEKHSYFPETIKPRSYTPNGIMIDMPLDQPPVKVFTPGQKVTARLHKRTVTGVVVAAESLKQVYQVLVGGKVYRFLSGELRLR